MSFIISIVSNTLVKIKHMKNSKLFELIPGDVFTTEIKLHGREAFKLLEHKTKKLAFARVEHQVRKLKRTLK